MAMRQDWNILIEDARQAGIPSFYAKGYMDMIPRIRRIDGEPGYPGQDTGALDPGA